MLLILDAEPDLDIEKEMSVEENTLNTKEPNGNHIENLNIKCNGNKQDTKLETANGNVNDSAKSPSKTQDSMESDDVEDKKSSEENKELNDNNCQEPEDNENEHKIQNARIDADEKINHSSIIDENVVKGVEKSVNNDIVSKDKVDLDIESEHMNTELENTTKETSVTSDSKLSNANNTEEVSSLSPTKSCTEDNVSLKIEDSSNAIDKNESEKCPEKVDSCRKGHESQATSCKEDSQNSNNDVSIKENDVSLEKDSVKRDNDNKPTMVNGEDTISISSTDVTDSDFKDSPLKQGNKDVTVTVSSDKPDSIVKKSEISKEVSQKEEVQNNISIDATDDPHDEIIEDDIISIKDESIEKAIEVSHEKYTVINNDEIEVIEESNVCSDKIEILQNVEPKEAVKSQDEALKNIENPKSIESEERVEDQKTTKVTSDITKDKQVSEPIELNDDIMDVDDVVEVTNGVTKSEQKVTSPVRDLKCNTTDSSPVKETSSIKKPDKPIICKLSNTLDILSDDDEEETPDPIATTTKPSSPVAPPKADQQKSCSDDKQCINLDEDDDIMLIDEDADKTEENKPVDITHEKDSVPKPDEKTDSETGEKTVKEADDLFAKNEGKETEAAVTDTNVDIKIDEKSPESESLKDEISKPLLPDDFLKTAKKNLADMTREELEEFCVLRIVESIVDRSNLGDIKNKLKTMAQGLEEYRKKVMMLTKQNRDLQVVLKSVQEEQKKLLPGMPITPLKITRSVGMQVYMEKSSLRRKPLPQVNPNPQRPKNLVVAGQSPQRPQTKSNNSNNSQNIPVPRLVPAYNPVLKPPNQNSNTSPKPVAPPNGVKTPAPSVKPGEKRGHNKLIGVTVDLTDDEPPTKISTKPSPAPPVRLVASQHLMPPQRQPFAQATNNPRKVYIPISAQNQSGMRPSHAIMLKPVTTPGIRPRGATPLTRMPGSQMRVNRVATSRHPAALPDCTKQYQPPNWKALPPAPDLKLTKVDNGIVISWKIDDYQEDSYEQIASYQLYAYQETSSPPSTALWKKIGDVKALPLPMACTLTQFMSGFKYYFAVRAVDVKSRLGPFSLPGSILLLNKL